MPSLNILDDLNVEIELQSKPKAIVSLVPSHTETLLTMGLPVIGRTKFCIHPQSSQSIANVGGTKNPKSSDIAILRPDLIIANKEENHAQDVQSLRDIAPVYTSDIKTLEDSFKFIQDMGYLGQIETHADKLILDIQQVLQGLPTRKTKPTVIYLIWRDPYMVAGGDTYISSMLEAIGFENIYKDLQRYPTVSADEILKADADYLFLSSEPYPFKQKHIDEIQALVPHSKGLLVDGELFSWYGSRILYKKEELTNLSKFS